MSDEQIGRIAQLLGEIAAKQDALRGEVMRYIESHDRRHDEDRRRADERHKLIDSKLEDHAAQINQAKGAKGAILAMAAAVSALIGLGIAAMKNLFRV
jgi:hypothetical protein